MIQAGKSTESTKPDQTKPTLEIMSGFVDPHGFLTLNIRGKSRDLYGLRIKEQYMDANGAVVTRQEDYPVWVESPSGPGIYRDGVRSCFIDVKIRERKDEKKWRKYLDNVRLRHELAKRKREDEDLVYIEPEKINRPPIWISVPEESKLRIFISLYNKSGQESKHFELNQVSSLFLTDIEKFSEEKYDEPSEWMPQIPETASPPDTNNAALLYYQAFLSRPKPDDATFWLIDESLRGIEPDKKSCLLIRKYLKDCRETIKYAHAASQIPRCDWGPLYTPSYTLSMSVISKSRQLCQLLNLYARALAAEKEYRAAFDSSLVIRRLAEHIGDYTLLMYSTSQTVNRRALICIQHILGSLPPDVETLLWLKNQLTAAPGASESFVPALKNDYEHAWQRLHESPKTIKRIMNRLIEQASVYEKGKEAAEKFRNLTNEKFILGIQEIASQVFADFFNSVHRAIESDKPYDQTYKEIELLTYKLRIHDELVPFYDLTSIEITPRLYKLHVNHKTIINAIDAAIEIYLVVAKTGRLPETLPDGLPKDPYTFEDFKYEITNEGFALYSQGEDFQGSLKRKLEFKVKK